MKGIDFILSSDALGGAELCTLALAEACADRIDTSVVLRPRSPTFETALSRGLRVRELEIGPKLRRRNATGHAIRFAQAKKRLHAHISDAARASRSVVLQFKWEEILWAGKVAPNRVALIEHGQIPRAVTTLPWARSRLIGAFSGPGSCLG